MTDTTKAPRTRRQLRAALEREQQRRQTFEERAAAAEVQMDAANWPRESPNGAIWLGGLYPRISGKEFARHIDASRQAVVEDKKRAAEQWAADLRTAADVARDEARRETLQTVIKALQITGYGALTTAALNRPETKVTHHNVDHFWADIQTALEVREEQKRAALREATEKKVAGLAPAQQLTFFFPHNSFDVTSPRMSDLLRGGRVTYGFDPAGGDGVGVATRVDETTPKKKPAKKKSEAKK